MKKETYIKITDTIRKNEKLEKAIIIANFALTFFIYILFGGLLFMLLLMKDLRFMRVVLTTGISFVALSIVRKKINSVN